MKIIHVINASLHAKKRILALYMTRAQSGGDGLGKHGDIFVDH